MATSPMCRVCCAVRDHFACRFCLCHLCPREGSRPLSLALLRLAVSAKTFHLLGICLGSLFSLFGWIERSLVLVCSSMSFLYVFCVRHFYVIFYIICMLEVSVLVLEVGRTLSPIFFLYKNIIHDFRAECKFSRGQNSSFLV